MTILIKELQRRLRESLSKEKELSKTISDLKLNLISLKDISQKDKSIMSSFKQKLSSLKTSNTSLQSDLSKSSYRVASYTKQIKNLAQERDSIIKELEEANSLRHTKEKEINNLEKTITSVSKDLEFKVKENESSSLKSSEEINTLKKSISSLSALSPQTIPGNNNLFVSSYSNGKINEFSLQDKSELKSKASEFFSNAEAVFISKQKIFPIVKADFISDMAVGFKASQTISRTKDEVKLFRPFYQAKPTHGRKPNVIYSYDGLMDVVNKEWPDWKEKGIWFNPKKDGITIQVHKQGDKVKIWTEDGSDITSRIPHIVEQVSKKPGDWIVIGELEWYKDGKHKPRADASGIVNAKTHPEKPNIVLTLYDKFYHGKDIHKLTYCERKKELDKINPTDNIKIIKQRLVKSNSEFKSAFNWALSIPGSEGAMLKLASAQINLGPSTDAMIKYKHERFLTGRVKAVHPVSGAKAWNYDIVVDGEKFEPKEGTSKRTSRKDTYVGRTYNTGIRTKAGSLVKIVYVDISKYIDPSTGKVFFNYWAPRLISVGGKNTTSIRELESMVEETTGRIAKKKYPTRFAEAEPETAKGFSKITYEEESEIIKENKKKPEAHKKHKFVNAVWTHPNGHPRCLICGDEARIPREGETPDKDGYGMCDGLKEGEFSKLIIIKNPVREHPDADAYILTDIKKSVWMKKGTRKPVFLSKSLLPKIKGWLLENIKITKINQPFQFKGKIIRPSNFQKNFAKEKRFVIQLHMRGASAHFDMRFERDGFLEGWTMACANEDEIKEPILTIADANELLKKDSVWKIDLDTGEEKKRTGKDGEETVEKIFCLFKARQPKGWLDISPSIQPKGSIGATKDFPGVFVDVDKGTFSRGADKPTFKEYFLNGPKWKKRIVFRQVAGLKRVKKLLTWLYWMPSEQMPYVLSKRAIKLKWLPKGYSALPLDAEKKVPTRFNYWRPNISREERLKRRKALVGAMDKKIKAMGSHAIEHFTLTRRYWKGATVVRGLEVEDYHIRFFNKKFHLDKNPIIKDVAALEFTGDPEFFKPGEYQPNTKINPNKKIPAFIEVIDDGSFDMELMQSDLIQIKFNGKKLKGMYVFKRSPSSKVWQMIKQKTPKSLDFSFKDFNVTLSEDVSFPYPVRVVAFAEGYWHNTHYSWDVVKEAAPKIIGASFVVEHTDGLLADVATVEGYYVNEEKKQIEVWGNVLDTSEGKDIATLLANQKVPGVSVRIRELIDDSGPEDTCEEIVEWKHVAFVRDPELGKVAKICNKNSCD